MIQVRKFDSALFVPTFVVPMEFFTERLKTALHFLETALQFCRKYIVVM